MEVKKAIVLAAGLGKRLRPLDASTPKPLMPIWGESMLARTVEMLRAIGVEEIAVNAHYRSEKIEEWCVKNGCRASVEKEILGTGGALNPLRGFIGREPFWLVNSDIVLDWDGDLWRHARRKDLGKDCIGWCLATDEEGPRTIEVEPQSGFVTCWKSPDPGASGTFTYCGAALLSPDILDYVPEAGFSTIVEAYERAAADGRFVEAVKPEGILWADAGTVESYIALNTGEDDNAYAGIPAVAAAAKATGAAGPVEFLGARGSDRCFFKRGGEVIVVYDDETRAENARYAGHARWLAAKGVRVPAVLADLPEEKTLVLEWGGSERKMDAADYGAVAEELAKLHALAGESDLPALEPQFDAALWRWEEDLFAEHCLGRRYAMEMPVAASAELKRAAERLDCEKRALVHRDFQSSNVLWREGKPCIIDFQGMRIGPGSYDLASLLCDPYAEIPEAVRQAAAKRYVKAGGDAGAVANLDVAAVRRLVQALGAFGRLCGVGRTEFARHVPSALKNLRAAAGKTGFAAIASLADDLIAREEHAHGHAHRHACAGNEP